MSQNRPPPAYMEYAAPTLSSIHFRVMTPAQRGLCWTLKLELWVNHSLPSDPDLLAKVLAMDSELVRTNLPAVMPLFCIKDSQIICPELEDYRNHLKERREKQKAGGKIGAEMTNGRRKEKSQPEKPSDSSRESSGEASANSRVLSIVKPSSAQSNRTQSLEKGYEHEQNSEWIKAYDRESNGK